MKLYADYAPFDADNFLTEPLFREWIARPTPEIDAYWQGLLKTHTHLRGPFEQARLLAQGMLSTWMPFSETYTNALFLKVQAELSADQPPVQTTRRVQFIPKWV